MKKTIQKQMPAANEKHSNKNQYEENLGTKKMWPLILQMSLPAIAAQLINLLYNIIDRIYIAISSCCRKQTWAFTALVPSICWCWHSFW